MRSLLFFTTIAIIISAALLAGSTLAEPSSVSVSHSVLPVFASAADDPALTTQWLDWLQQNPPDDTSLRLVNGWYRNLKHDFSQDKLITPENDPYFGSIFGLRTDDYVDHPEFNVWLYNVSFVVEQVALSDEQALEQITLVFYSWDKGRQTQQYLLKKENDVVLAVGFRDDENEGWVEHPIQNAYPPALEIVKQWTLALQSAYDRSQGIKIDCADDQAHLADDCTKYRYVLGEKGYFGVVEKVFENGLLTQSRYLADFVVAERQIDERYRSTEYWLAITKDKSYSDYGIIFEANLDGTETAYHYQRNYEQGDWIAVQPSSPAPNFIGSIILSNPDEILVLAPAGGLEIFFIY